MVAEGNVGLAFGLVAAAGACTTIGASAVLFGNVCKPRLLAAALAFAAGVMLYVSFVEIFSAKAIVAFQDDGHDLDTATRYATFCFFGGIAIVYLLDLIVHGITALAIWLKKKEVKKPSVQNLKALISRRSRRAAATPTESVAASTPPASLCGAVPADVEAGLQPSQQATAAAAPGEEQQVTSTCMQVVAVNPIFAAEAAASAAAGSSPGGKLPSADASAAQAEPKANLPHRIVDRMGHALHGAEEAVKAQFPSIEPASDFLGSSADGEPGNGGGPHVPAVPRDPDVAKILQEDCCHNYALMKMGLLTALAIFIHNFPEGLATFVSTLADASTGVTVAIAIAIHNVPEGVCVALPIYYATGSRWKGFFWGCVSGLSEPLGALFGYFLLYDTGDATYAIVFGIVAGMMVCISLKELLPTALKYDPSGRLVMACLFLGMGVMAASLLLFAL